MWEIHLVIRQSWCNGVLISHLSKLPPRAITGRKFSVGPLNQLPNGMDSLGLFRGLFLISDNGDDASRGDGLHPCKYSQTGS